MRILTRYVLGDLLKLFVISLAGITLLMVLIGVGQEATRQGLRLGAVVRLIPYILPDALRFSVPGTILLVSACVYGRMSASGEVIAVKSLGISPMVLLWPVFLLAGALSLWAVWLNNVAVTWGRAGVQRVVVESVEQIAYGMLQTHRSYSTRRMAMNVKDVRERELIKPTLTMKARGDQPAVTIVADKAELESNPEDGTLTMKFLNATIDVGKQGGMSWPGVYEHVVDLQDFSRKDDGSGRTSNRSLWDISGDIRQQRQSIAQLQREMAAEAAFQAMRGDFAQLTSDPWATRRAGLATARKRLSRLRAEPHRRWANGASCLCFVLVGAPLAIRRRNADFLSSFFVCFLPVLLAYYPLLAYGVDKAKGGELPPSVVWLGNLVFILWGVWLLRRVLRY